ncbi:FAD-dependent oxidoreductase [Tumebacillus sp. DT12]|uniref:FAD-dependent oxidoreductase n=1 Tax=Tumebacillus lacus TaxID=2995335 RepID=A0ABT3X8M2_9BACL|nr:FAD-dependent oxidoreductase [Tumebacillus lacus]MCX7572257.1 FAD-dependent oxidoreductase [Tumebacillus lacus]
MFTKRTVVVGGGLAGLSVAARLAKSGVHVTLLEKAPKLGGRAVTIPLKGFDFNFGAHAIYARDSSYIRKLERELGLDIGWADFDPKKARYDLGDEMTEMPATLEGLYKTKVLPKGSLKARFALDIVKTVCWLERGEEGVTIGEWLKRSGRHEDVIELMLTLASSNFFTQEPERIPSTVYFKYYQRLFTTNKAVSYIAGGWESLVKELERVVKESGSEIVTKAKIEGVEFEEGRVRAVRTGEGVYEADEFVFAVPPKELGKIFAETGLQESIAPYLLYRPNTVLVYDIGLTQRIDTPYTYIYDKEARVFMTDISAYTNCTPPGGQMIQAIAYLKSEEVGDREHAQMRKESIQKLFDKHLPGWRDQLAAQRYTERAAAQEIKVEDDQKLMPVQFHACKNAYFAGDWVQGVGQLSELSFSSGYEVGTRILHRAGLR